MSRQLPDCALELGASGFVVKGWAVTELLPAIDAVLAGSTNIFPMYVRCNVSRLVLGKDRQ